MENQSTEEILNELMDECKVQKMSSVEIHFDEVSKRIINGDKRDDIVKDLRISTHTYSNIFKLMKIKKMY